MFIHTYTRRVAAGLAATALAATALPLQAQQNMADDARADVPATRYQPAYDIKAPQSEPTSPERNWQALNRTVGGTEARHGHDAHDGRHGQPAAPPAAPAPAAAPAATAANKEAPKAAHQHHHGEHH